LFRGYAKALVVAGLAKLVPAKAGNGSGTFLDLRHSSGLEELLLQNTFLVHFALSHLLHGDTERLGTVSARKGV
jgi:hypothetical protein